ncbi:MAG: hypothetical protein AB1384_09565 [Actinomycetota bacterium]
MRGKTRLNAVVNIVMFAILLIASVSGILLGTARSGSYGTGDIAEPAAQASRPGGLLHLWIHLHIATCAVLLALITTHLLLHIPYIKKLPRLLAGRSSPRRQDEHRQEGRPDWQGSGTSVGIK